MNRTYSIEDFLEVKASGDASFSPDGTHIAYLSTVTGTSQVFIVPTSGGEPKQLTDFPDSISFAHFSPRENVLIFGKAEGGNERAQLYLMDIGTMQTTNLTAKPDVRHNFGGWSPDGKSICFTSNERNGKDFDVYVMDIATSETRCIFDEGEWCVAEGFSPKGTYVVVRKEHSSASSDLYICNLETGVNEHVTPHDGQVFYTGAHWLPSESAFFTVQDKDREFKGLARYSLDAKELKYVLTPDCDIGGVTIDNQGKNIALSFNRDGYERVTIYNAETFEVRSLQLPEGNIYRSRFSTNGTQLAFNLGDSRQTLDVWMLDLESGDSHQLTHSHQGVPPEVMVEPELIRFTSFDGLSIPAFLYQPKTTDEGTRVPVVIHIHGGPAEQYKPTYQAVIQYLVYNGYAVVAPNIRGSTGYGKTYAGLDDVDKRIDSVRDIVALREHLASMQGLDSTRVAVYGASYGGFMVLACLAFYPEYWAAGIDIVGIVNFETFLENTAPYRRANREAEYGSLEHDRELLKRISPINSLENIKAPLFVIHGANDPRVPLSEAEQAVTKLKELGRTVEFVVYPDEGHGIAKLKNKLDAYPRAVTFLDGVLRPAK